jgi:serine/threonine-protein kinase
MTNSTPAILCPACHEENARRALFCQHCGHDVVLNNAGPRYVLTRIIKEGGQGAVFAALDEQDKVVAVKEMLDRFSEPAERAAAVQRFEAEAAMLQRLRHPQIPQIYASFHDEGRHYLTMEFVEGEDLAEIVEREGPIEEQRVLEWARQICEVLGFLHEQGVVYRDMKPSNLMLRPDGTIILIDVGIARVLQRNTQGTQIGTPGYAPPEQYQGLFSEASDIFALAATLHHLLSGRDPQDEQPFTFPPLRDIAPKVSQRSADAIARALHMRPEDRFSDLDAFCTALLPPRQQSKRAPQKTTAKPTPKPVPTPPPAAATASTSAARVGANPTPAQQAAPVARRNRGWPVVLFVMALLLGSTAVVVVFALADNYRPSQVLPSATSLTNATNALPSTVTPIVYVAQSFTVRSIEIVVQPGSDGTAIFNAFQAAYLELARRNCNCDVQLQDGTLRYLAGEEPVALGGNRFRASLAGTILVPQ